MRIKIELETGLKIDREITANEIKSVENMKIGKRVHTKKRYKTDYEYLGDLDIYFQFINNAYELPLGD